MEEIKLNLNDFIKDTIIKLTLDKSIEHIRDTIDDKNKSLLYKIYSKHNSIDKAIKISIDKLIKDNTFKAYLVIFKIIENNDDLNVIGIVEKITNVLPKHQKTLFFSLNFDFFSSSSFLKLSFLIETFP